MTIRFSQLAAASVAITVLACCASASLGAAVAVSPCHLYASPTGSDTNAGTLTSPLQTPQALVDDLAPGQTGCLEAGTYSGYLRISHGGAANSPLTVEAQPGATVLFLGRIWIMAGSNYVTLEGLAIDGAHSALDCSHAGCPVLPTVTINGNSATVTNDKISNEHTGICMSIGTDAGGTATNTVVNYNVIHGCGQLPATNQEHGIYVADSINAVITNNYIFDNADRGVQLYPHAMDTLVRNNVIDSNGEGVLFGGDHSDVPSSGNIVSDNIISDSAADANIDSYFAPRQPAVVNRVTDNCLWGGQVNAATGGVVARGGGFTTAGDILVNPMSAECPFLDSAAVDFNGAGRDLVAATRVTMPAASAVTTKAKTGCRRSKAKRRSGGTRESRQASWRVPRRSTCAYRSDRSLATLLIQHWNEGTEGTHGYDRRRSLHAGLG